jgi:hypothetical protein
MMATGLGGQNHVERHRCVTIVNVSLGGHDYSVRLAVADALVYTFNRIFEAPMLAVWW